MGSTRRIAGICTDGGSVHQQPPKWLQILSQWLQMTFPLLHEAAEVPSFQVCAHLCAQLWRPVIFDVWPCLGQAQLAEEDLDVGINATARVTKGNRSVE